MHIVFSEATEHVNALFPFSSTHCSWEIRCGILQLWQKWQLLFPQAELLFCSERTDTLSLFSERYNIQSVFSPATLPIASDIRIVIEGNVLPSEQALSLITYFTKENSEGTLLLRSDKDSSPDSLPSLYYLWDAISANGQEIRKDLQLQTEHYNFLPISDQCTFIALRSAENILVGEQVSIGDFCVLDATNGPIVLDAGVTIMHHSTIIGPCYIGKNSTIKVGAKIYADTTFGEHCKVGGEVENSIIHAYSNKQHDGFLGHSYIGEWVNIGADTNTSDLKNNYSSVWVRFPDDMLNTGRMFLGLLCGDHVKIGINTMFNTGTVVGAFSNVFGSDFPDKYLPPFTWGKKKTGQVFDLVKALLLAERVKQRRKQELTETERRVFTALFSTFHTIE